MILTPSRHWMRTAAKTALVAALICLPASARSFQNVEYARPEGAPLTMDGYVPDGDGPFPTAIIVHGGAWIGGDKGHSVDPLFPPLEQAGFAWFSINYRLADRNDIAALLSPQGLTTITGASDDVRSAIAFLKESAEEFHLDPARMVLVGESAGAQLAELAALKPGPDGQVAGIVAFYSPSDLVSLAQTSDRVPNQIRQALIGSPLGQLLLASLMPLSPRYLITASAPPFLLLHGTRDSLVPFAQSVDMCQAVEEAGVACELYTVEGGDHGLRRWEGDTSMTSYKERMVDWLTGLFAK